MPGTSAKLFGNAAQAKATSSPRAKMAMQAAPPPPTLRAGPVTAPATPAFERFGWAFMDLRTNQLAGSSNKDTMPNTTESMIKPWLAADYLSRLGNEQLSAAMRQTITSMIEDSNDEAANTVYKADGGLASIKRLIATCKLTETELGASWSETRITPADAVRYGKCIADDTAAGPTWTPWLLDKMRHVEGSVKDNTPSNVTMQGGHWGIVDALPESLAEETAIKNGWTYIYADSRWHINCLAINPDWILTVEMQFAGSQTYAGLQQGADACASVSRQLLYTPDV
ncbi:serine hydrolase [Rugosimonospora acidiphila]|uniref:Serine hydrolase n=1 Tax=Rugosimonospora acidiphila TaxID=556531 RepID=A0ABP9S0U2_9ACTN